MTTQPHQRKRSQGVIVTDPSENAELDGRFLDDVAEEVLHSRWGAAVDAEESEVIQG